MATKKNLSKTPKHRALVLFAKDTPFKPKIVRSKKVYSRKVKHK